MEKRSIPQKYFTKAATTLPSATKGKLIRLPPNGSNSAGSKATHDLRNFLIFRNPWFDPFTRASQCRANRRREPFQHLAKKTGDQKSDSFVACASSQPKTGCMSVRDPPFVAGRFAFESNGKADSRPRRRRDADAPWAGTF